VSPERRGRSVVFCGRSLHLRCVSGFGGTLAVGFPSLQLTVRRSHCTVSMCVGLLNHPLIYCEGAGSPGACPRTCRPDIALVRAARLPWPTRRVLSGIGQSTSSGSHDACIPTSGPTPLVIRKIRCIRFAMRQTGANAPSTVARVIAFLTVPIGWNVRLRGVAAKASRPISAISSTRNQSRGPPGRRRREAIAAVINLRVQLQLLHSVIAAVCLAVHRAVGDVGDKRYLLSHPLYVIERNGLVRGNCMTRSYNTKLQ
jgi:hypothetical protein